MEYKDYYKTLGVPRDASDKDIKAAFRRLARKYHPDVNKGDKKAEARFKEINEANAVLSDPEKRKRYDTLGPDWANFRPPAGAPAGGPGAPGGGRVYVDFGGGEGGGGFSDFFNTIFGGGFGRAGAGGGAASEGGGFDFEDLFGRAARGARPPQGQDVEAVADLTLEDVLRGATRGVRLEDGGTPRTVEVKIPPGIRDGSRVRAAGEGAGQAGGPRGDLFIRARVQPHPQFERKGDDLHTTVTVPLTTAILGGEAQVPTLEGPVGIKVPPGSRPGRTFRLRGHGLPHLEAPGQRGDLLASLAVDLPREVSPRARELYEELKKEGH
jgi:DnaJ-class molecular chaperone